MPSITKFCDAMRWAADSDKPGYSQSDRYSLTPEKFFTDELTNTDCSELTIVALQYAGFDTGWASYTGNMSAALCANGWERLPNDGNPQRGDILLNDVNHVAVWLGDCLAQASIGDGGLVSGGARGDQTGWEVNTRDYYNYPWDCYLRYTGPDDESEDDDVSACDVWSYRNEDAGDDRDMHAMLVDIHKACGGGYRENVAAWSYKNPEAGDKVDMHAMVVDTMETVKAMSKTVTAMSKKVAAMEKQLAKLPK